MNNCPSSTPRLNDTRLNKKFVCDKPISVITPAKPNPCNKPKKKTTSGLHNEIFFKNIFSTAM